MLGLAGLAFAACSNDDENITSGREDGRVRVTLSLGRTETTRSVGQTAAGLYNDITDIKIIFYNSAGAYIAVPATGTVGDKEYDNETAINNAIKEGLNDNVASHKVTVELKGIPSSATQMYVVANGANKSNQVGTASLEDAKKTTIFLKNQIKSEFTRFSGEESRLTGLAQIDASGKANVQLRPVPSRIELANVTAVPLPTGETWGGANIKSFTVVGFYINAFFPMGSLDPTKDEGTTRTAIDNRDISENYTKAKYRNIIDQTIAGDFTGDWSMMCDEPTNEYTYAEGAEGSGNIYTATMNNNQKWGYMILQGNSVDVVVKLNVTYADDTTATKFLTITSYTYKSGFTDGFGNSHTAGSKVETMLRGHVYQINNINFDVTDLTDVPYETTKTVNAEVEVLPWVAVEVEPGFE